MEESSEILTIFPWYSYLVSLFILALGIIALRRKPTPERRLEHPPQPYVSPSAWSAFLSRQCRIWRMGGVFKLTDSGYPVFSFRQGCDRQ
ncbi:Putative phosphoethanolamine transferase ybiP [Serratia fonticola]|uniref:Phosphoethanolamine transferase ybiP n=1 Tax=Serratia fonticola TaxID=47917 RepID=A0A4U9WP85_SERFO|nr:Putative phosphoethanolamine transferase ybiP [Serratia fonticola]